MSNREDMANLIRAVEAVEKLCNDAEEALTVIPSQIDRIWINSVRAALDPARFDAEEDAQ